MNNIKKLREAAGYNMKEAAAMLGIPYTTYVNYEKGYREPNSEMLIKIADLFDTTVDYIIGKTNSFIPTAENIIPMPKMRKIPLIGTIACGTPILAVENIEDEVDIPEEIHADFALRCKGDSMIDADIHSGDIVYIRQQDEVDPGQIAAVLVEDEATLKRFYYDASAGVVTLVPANSALSPQFYQGETLNHIKILGLAVGLTRSLKGLNYTCI